MCYHFYSFPFCVCAGTPLLQEMMDIVKAIYDMMGKYTYPVLKEDAPRQHVEVFFQVLDFLCVFLNIRAMH